MGHAWHPSTPQPCSPPWGEWKLWDPRNRARTRAKSPAAGEREGWGKGEQHFLGHLTSLPLGDVSLQGFGGPSLGGEDSLPLCKAASHGSDRPLFELRSLADSPTGPGRGLSDPDERGGFWKRLFARGEAAWHQVLAVSEAACSSIFSVEVLFLPIREDDSDPEGSPFGAQPHFR